MSDRATGGSGPAPFDRRDFVGLVGLCLLGYGAWLVYEPAGVFVPGAVLCGVAVFGVRG